MDILSKIISKKIDELNQLKRSISISDLESSEFFERNNKSIVNGLIENEISIIAEHKRKSPSKSEINSQTPTEKIINGYQEAGAAALSILTEKNFFNGSTNDILNARKITELPILRKDFIIDEFQIFESRFIGADCILLIVACLNDTELNDFYNISKSLKMDALIEVHNEDELQRALKLKPKMIGINNRNLKNMTVALDTSIKLVKKIPNNILVVSESGFKNHSDLKLMEHYGIKSFLIGETFMKSKNIQSSVENILFGRNNA